MNTSPETRDRIITAAGELFLQYGYHKTTMADIARACGMSAANIYRFFESKKEIIAELANGYFDQTIEALRQSVQQPRLSAADKLRIFVMQLLQTSYDLYANQPRINECVEFIASQRFDLVARYKEAKQALIAEILAEGNARGEFAIANIITVAEEILHATIFIGHPFCLQHCDHDQLKRLASGVTDLLISGLESSRPPEKP